MMVGIFRTFVLIPVGDSEASVFDRVHQRPGHVAGYGSVYSVHVRHHQHILPVSCLGEVL